MSQFETFTDAVQVIADHVRAGQVTRARELARTALDGADAWTLKTIASCVQTIENYPVRCVDMLRAKWDAANRPSDRALIAMFGKAAKARGSRPEPRPQVNKPRDTAPRNEHTEVRLSAVRPMTAERRAELKTHNKDEGLMRAYAEGAPATPEPGSANKGELYASGIDYDQAALCDIRGLPCVLCWTERATSDGGAILHDDALCGECRDRGRSGIPAKEGGRTLAEFVEARCAFIATKQPKAALRIIRRWWSQAPRCPKASASGVCRCIETRQPCGSRAVIVRWMSQNTLLDNVVSVEFTKQVARPKPRPADLNCTRCGSKCAALSDQRLCVDCVEVDTLVAA